MGGDLKMTADILLTKCREFGVTLAPGADGKLRVTPRGRLPEALREALRQRKAEVLALLIRQPSPWPCTHCGKPAEIEAERGGKRVDAPAGQQQSPAPPDYRTLYREMAEAVREDCFLIDPAWLLVH